MPKQIFTIQDFKGGLNTFSGSKDIAHNEFTSATGVSFKKPGEISTGGGAKASTLTAGASSFYPPVPGEGMFFISSDYKLLSANNTLLDDIGGSATYLDAGNYHVLFYLSENGNANAVLNLVQWKGDAMSSALSYTSSSLAIATGFATGTYIPMFYTIDGGIRCGIQNFNTNTAALQGRKLLTIVSRKLWGCATSALPHIRGWIFGASLPKAPIKDTNIHFVAADSAGNTYGTPLPTDTDWAANSDVEGQGYNNVTIPDVGTLNGLTIRMRYYDTYTYSDPDITHVNAGTWTGKTRWYASFIYDGSKELGTGQESPMTEMTSGFFGTNDDANRTYIMDVQVRFSTNNSAYNVFNKRITGINIYYSEWTVTSGYGERYLSAEIDCHRGFIKKAQDENWQVMETPWSEGTGVDDIDGSGTNTGSYANYEDFLLREPYYGTPFYLSAGYGANDSIDAQFKHTAVLNRRVYAANVITSEKAHGDRMMKSLVNKFDIFTEGNYVDVDVNDGDQITHLEGFADRILQFKKNVLYIINVSPTAPDFIEAKYDYMGVNKGCQVAKTEDGVVWANKYGLFVYDGKRPVNVTDNRISKDDWEAHIQPNTVVGYDPVGKQVLVISSASHVGSTDSHMYVLDLKTMTFALNNFSPELTSGQMYSNFVNLGSNGQLTTYYSTGSVSASNKFYHWDHTPQDQVTYRLGTKDFDFDHPGIKKRVYNVKVTYKCGANESGIDPIISVMGLHDGDAVELGTLETPSGEDFVTQTLECGVDFKNLYNFGILFFNIPGTTVPKEFVITDISCVYRIKTIK